MKEKADDNLCCYFFQSLVYSSYNISIFFLLTTTEKKTNKQQNLIIIINKIDNRIKKYFSLKTIKIIIKPYILIYLLFSWEWNEEKKNTHI